MKRFQDIASRLKVKTVHYLAGEHDASLDEGEAFQKFFGKLHYTFDHKGVHFIVLDNVSDPSAIVGDKQLAWLKTDLTKLRRDTWEGQPAFVVGAAAGDSTTSQFWIDSDRLAALRMVQKERRGTRDIVTDIRFGKFAEFGGIPIATEVLQYRDGRLVFREQRVDIRVNDPIPDATFDAEKWK